MPAARTSRSANPSPLPTRRTGCEETGGSGDQIALKDGKYLLVVQYIWHGPFRPSTCGALKLQQSQQRATGNNGIDRSPRDRQRLPILLLWPYDVLLVQSPRWPKRGAKSASGKLPPGCLVKVLCETRRRTSGSACKRQAERVSRGFSEDPSTPLTGPTPRS